MLCYGIDLDFLLDNPDIPELDLEQFAVRVHEYGGLLIQAHPYREAGYIDHIRLFPRSVHGVEVFNAKADKEANDNSLKWAKEINASVMTSGSDCHRESGVGFGGIITKEPIKSNEDLLRILKSGEYELIKNQR